MLNLEELSSEIHNSITENKENAMLFKKRLEKAKSIIISGDNTLDPILTYTFYLLAKEKKVLVARSSQINSKLNYDLMIEFKKLTSNENALKITFKNDIQAEEILLKGSKIFSQSVLLTYLTMIVNLTNGSEDRKKSISKIIEDLFTQKDTIYNIKKDLQKFGRCFCLGRSMGFAIAQEICSILTGGLQIHAESYPAGESKHGPIALIEDGFPVIQIIDDVKYRKKMINSIMEMKARGAKIVSITHLLDDDIKSLSNYTIKIKNGRIEENALIHIPYIITAIVISNL